MELFSISTWIPLTSLTVSVDPKSSKAGCQDVGVGSLPWPQPMDGLLLSPPHSTPGALQQQVCKHWEGRCKGQEEEEEWQQMVQGSGVPAACPEAPGVAEVICPAWVFSKG